jgi:hypothetical protein
VLGVVEAGACRVPLDALGRARSAPVLVWRPLYRAGRSSLSHSAAGRFLMSKISLPADQNDEKKAEHTAEILAGVGGILAALAGIGPFEKNAVMTKGLLVVAVVSFAFSTYFAWRAYQLKRSRRHKG